MLCGVCLQYCAELWIRPLEDVLETDPEYRALEDALRDLDRHDDEYSRLEDAQEAIRSRLREEHRRLSDGRWSCFNEGHEALGPWHLEDGRPRTICDRCDGGQHDGVDIDGHPGWNVGSLDHARCPICQSMEVAWATLPREEGRAGSDVEYEVTRAPEAPLLDAVLATGPADREAVLAAVRGCPVTAGLAVEWVASPQELPGEVADEDEDETADFPAPWSLWSLAPGSVLGRITRALSSREPGDDEWDSLRRITASLRLTIATEIGRESPLSAIGETGQLDALTPLLGAGLPEDDETIGFVHLLKTLRTSAGLVHLDGDRLVITERPSVVRLDSEGRLHAEDGPALAWADGLELWAIHGVTVPEHVACDPSEITVAEIDAEWNAEVRRVMVERFGAERLLREGGADLVHEDATGRLWRRPPKAGRASAEPVVMVEVVNSTPEPDGTFRTYFLRVPPTMRTAREAVAWTFQMEEKEYRPDVET